MQALFWSGTLNNKSVFRCRHLGCLTSRGGLVQRGCRAGGGAILKGEGENEPRAHLRAKQSEVFPLSR